MSKKRILCLLFFIFYLPVLSFGEGFIPATIFSGNICTKWKGIVNLPCQIDTNISFTDVPSIVLLENSVFFRFGLTWRGENESSVSQRCSIIINVEKETYPDSGKWTPLFEEAVKVMSRQGEKNEKSIITKDILQEKPEVKYKIIVQTTMPFGQRTKQNQTYITVRRTLWPYTITTVSPIIPIPILHEDTSHVFYRENIVCIPIFSKAVLIIEKLPVPSIIPESKPQPEGLLPVVEEDKRAITRIAPTVEVQDILINGDFASGLVAWELVKKGRGHEMYARWITNDEIYPFAVEIKRSGSEYVKGEMGIKQVLNKDVSKYTQLFLKAEEKIIHSSLKSDGNQGGAYPIGIRIDYLDADNKAHIWQQGFLYVQKINYQQIGMQIPQDNWHSYSTINLMELNPKPLVIKEIRLSGSGWRFHSRIAKVGLIGILP